VCRIDATGGGVVFGRLTAHLTRVHVLTVCTADGYNAICCGGLSFLRLC
jgi:hypothetical protein